MNLQLVFYARDEGDPNFHGERDPGYVVECFTPGVDSVTLRHDLRLHRFRLVKTCVGVCYSDQEGVE